MNKIDNFENLPNIKYYKQHGHAIVSNNNSYFRAKNNKIRMYDDTHIIKKSGSNIEYLIELVNLNVEGVNTPNDIGYSDNEYFIISKYLDNTKSLLSLSKNILSLKDYLIIIDKLLSYIENCHKQDFYIIDINSLNVLIDNSLTPYLYDFDTSCFIKDNKLIAISNDINSYINDNFINQVLTKYYNNNGDINSYKDKFIFIDKLEIISLIIENLLERLDISFNTSEYLNNYELIRKIGLSHNFENNIINLINGLPLAKDNYFHEEVQELATSHFVRKRKFR